MIMAAACTPACRRMGDCEAAPPAATPGMGPSSTGVAAWPFRPTAWAVLRALNVAEPFGLLEAC